VETANFRNYNSFNSGAVPVSVQALSGRGATSYTSAYETSSTLDRDNCALRHTVPTFIYSRRSLLPIYNGEKFRVPYFGGNSRRCICAVSSHGSPVSTKFSWSLVFFGVLVAWMVVANTLGVLPEKAFWSNFERMDGWVTLVHTFALFIVAGTVLSVEKLWRRWWLFFISVAGIVCLHGLIQLSGGAEIHQGGTRLTASFGNAIYLAVYLVFSFMIAGWLALHSRGWVRNALIAFLPLSALILFFTGSRGPLIGLAAGVTFAAALWLLLSRNEWKGGNASLGLKLAAGSLVALVLGAGSLFLVAVAAFGKSDSFLSRDASVFSLEQELKVRSTIWGMAMRGVQEDPLTGWGQEGFNQIFNKYYEPSLYEQETWFDRAHNMYIDWLVAGGIPALMLFLALLAASALALLRTKDITRAERVLLVGALVAYAVQALVVFDNLFSYVPLVMLFAMAHDVSGKKITFLQKAPEIRSGLVTNLIGAGVAVTLIIVVWTVNVPGIRAANHLLYALSPARNIQENFALFQATLNDASHSTQEIREQLVNFAGKTASDENIPAPMREQFVRLALEEMGKEVAQSPNDARLRVQYASILGLAGDDDAALVQLDKAIELSPKKQVLHINRGSKLQDLGRYEEAREAYRHAYNLDRSFDKVGVITAAAIMLAGDVPAGRALLIDAVGTTTSDSDLLFYAYYETKQWNEMIAVARARVALTEGSPESRYRLAQALAAASRFREARAEIVTTMNEYPESREQGEELLNRIPAAQ